MKRNSSNKVNTTTTTVSNATTSASKTRTAKQTEKKAAPKAEEQTTLTLDALTDEQRELGLALRYIMEHTSKDGKKVLALDKQKDNVFIKAADGLDKDASKSATWSIRQSAIRLGGKYNKDDGSYVFPRKEFSNFVSYYKLVKDIDTEDKAEEGTPKEKTKQSEKKTAVKKTEAEPMMTKSEAMARTVKVIREMFGKKFMSDDAINEMVSEAFAC